MRFLKLLVNIILPFFIITSCTQQEIDIFTQGGGRFDITLVDDIAKTRSLPSEIKLLKAACKNIMNSSRLLHRENT